MKMRRAHALPKEDRTYDTVGYRTDVRRDPKDRKTWRWTLSTIDSPTVSGRGYPNERTARAACQEALARHQRGEGPKVAPQPQDILYE